MIHIGDTIKARTIKLDLPNKKPQSERGELLRYFADEMDRDIRYIGVRCAHYSVSDLYALKSGYIDRQSRNGPVKARIYFWGLTKTKSGISA